MHITPINMAYDLYVVYIGSSIGCLIVSIIMYIDSSNMIAFNTF